MDEPSTALLTHVVAVSLLERTADGDDITDSIARDCTRRSTGQLASNSLALGTGGMHGYRGLAVWRVSSVSDLMRRMSRLPDASLSKVDIVGHGNPGHLFVGVANEREREGDPDACISVVSAGGIAALRRKLVAGSDEARSSIFERLPRIRLVGCDVGRGDAGRELVAAVSAALGGVVVMATTEKLGSYCPLMELEEAA
jgi:hypothetical protein